MESLGFTVILNGKSVDAAIVAVTAALQVEGFGILTDIDVKATFKKKLDVEFRPYRILGACNPKLAHRALSDNADVGLLLPCNVVVEEIAGGARVNIVDPRAMFQVMGGATPALAAVAEEAEMRLKRVAAALRQA